MLAKRNLALNIRIEAICKDWTRERDQRGGGDVSPAINSALPTFVDLALLHEVEHMFVGTTQREACGLREVAGNDFAHEKVRQHHAKVLQHVELDDVGNLADGDALVRHIGRGHDRAFRIDQEEANDAASAHSVTGLSRVLQPLHAMLVIVGKHHTAALGRLHRAQIDAAGRIVERRRVLMAVLEVETAQGAGGGGEGQRAAVRAGGNCCLCLRF